MLERARTSRPLWRTLLAFLGVALGGSIWAGFFAGGCGSCAGSGGGGGLAQAGALYYAALFGTALVLGRSRWVWIGVSLAASVHAALLTLLFTRREFCPPCLLTGASAIAAAGVSCLIEPLNLARASVLLPVAAVGTQVSVFAFGLLAPPPAPDGKGLPRGPERREGMVVMVVYERADCTFCRRLEEEVLPGLTREFGPKLEVERRSAEEFPGLPTPTLLLSGPGGRRSYPGLPPRDVLRDAILDCLGDSHDGQAMLPASR